MDKCSVIEWAIDAGAPSAAASRVLITLARLSEDGVCSASQIEIARRSFLSERQTRTILKQLEAHEYALISRERRGGSGHGRHYDVYRLALPEQPEKAQPANIAAAIVEERATGNFLQNARKEPEQPAISVEFVEATGNPRQQPANIAATSEATGNPPHTPQSSPHGEEVVVLSGQRESGALVAVPVKTDWVARLAEAHKICDGALDFALGGDIHTARAFRQLCEPPSGIPCDWELDVVPALVTTAHSFRRQAAKMRSWTPLREHALKNRDMRLAGLPEPKSQSELFSDAAGADNVEHFDVERTRQNHSKPQGGQRGPGRRSPDSPFDGVRELINRAREDERRQRNDGMDQPHMRYLGGA